MNFADTHWLASVYIEPQAEDTEAVKRRRVVERFMRQHGGQLAISDVVLLEARNLFSRVTGEELPLEWQTLEADLGGRLHVDRMNWDLLRRACNALFAKYAWQAALGTFDTAIVASVKLAGATRFLSFDADARALASAEGIGVFPALEPAERRLVARLKR
jgi:predicted nucleic acid-binding protein